MALRTIGTVMLPPHRRAGGFDHASIDRSADRLYVAHTANDGVEVIDLAHRRHEATLEGFPGVAGAAVHERRGLLVATCRAEATVGVAALSDPATITRLAVGPRPNGLALAAGSDLALAACIGDPTPPSCAMIDLGRSEVLARVSLPGRPRWVVHDEEARCFYVNIAAPSQIAVVSAAPPFDVVRSMPVPAAGPHGLELDARRGLLHCACDAGSVVTVEAASGRVVGQVQIAGGPDVVFFNARRDRLYVAIGDAGALQTLDTMAARVVETTTTEKGAHTFGFDADREHVYALVPAAHAARVFAES